MEVFPPRKHQVIFPSSSTPASLRKTPGGPSPAENTHEQSLKSLVESRCPSLFHDYRPPWFLFNGHAQTFYTRFGDFSKIDRMSYTRGLDFAPIETSNLDERSPIIVALPGLTGGSYEPYIRAILCPASTTVKSGGLGYRVVVVNGRGCAGVPVTSPRLYTAGHTDDLRQALVYISQIYPEAPLLGLGFSMGAGILVRYLAEEGFKSRLVSGCALAGPWDLVLNSHLLVKPFFTRNVWARGMGTNWLNLLRRHEKTLRSFPENTSMTSALKPSLALKYPTLPQFDAAFTRRVGGPEAVFPFADVDAYYRWASSDGALQHVRVPLVAINSTDDPLKDGGRWVTKPVLEWFKMTAEGLDLVQNKSDDQPRVYVDEEGFFREEGRNGMGCKDSGEGGVVDGNKGHNGMMQGL
ncbi:Alpha/Beta hydrolase protein [Mycena crocata]|nr:Alpha/Beta hydrolase protein [Mycena crocata]